MKIIEATGIRRWLANLFISLNLGYGSWVESSSSGLQFGGPEAN